MSPPRATLVVSGQVVVAARADRLLLAEAIGIAGGRVVSAGERRDVVDGAAPGARVVDAGAAAVIPGIHDFHLHLVGMARARRDVTLDDATDMATIVARVAAADGRLPAGAWLTGGRWEQDVMAGDLSALRAALGERPALLTAHDGHTAWASPAALAAAALDVSSSIAGGRLERDANGQLTGVVRERAMLPLLAAAERLEGAGLGDALAETVEELLGWGITGATDAGDYDAERGIGTFARLGESFSRLWEARAVLDGRLRVTVDLPAAAIAAAEEMGLTTGASLAGTATLRAGWAKVYTDGTLGSRTAALFSPSTCRDGDDDDLGILRTPADELDAILAAARRAGIGIAAHAIGDRAAAAALDAVQRAVPRTAGQSPDRLEHAQLVRPADRARFAALDVTASVQPVHLVSDRDTADACWEGRLAHAYAYRSLAAAGARLVFGTDAPIERPDPWRNLHAAVRRNAPGDGRPPWRADEALELPAALAAATLGPAIAIGRSDEGHLAVGARADLAVLSCDVETLLAADERLGEVRSQLTMVDGREVHRS